MGDMTQDAMASALTDEQLIDVLISSLYPGAKRESAAMVLAYCRAASLDPMLKPVHIVPMSVKAGTKDRNQRDEYVMRDTVMPGIGLYRIQASRTGEYAGMDEPLLGPMRTFEFMRQKRTWVENGTKPDGSTKYKPVDDWVKEALEYPEWVQITVYRLVGGFRHPYPAREWWMENYATAGKDSDAPNAMWARRTIGQLLKCAEAQALRKGFPEVGSQPTAEEMQGREFDHEPGEVVAEATTVQAKAPMRASEAAAATGNVASPAATALTDDTARQQEGAALFNATIVPASTPVHAEVKTAAPPPEAKQPPPPPPPPAPAETPAASPPATDGERANVIVTAKAKKRDLADVLQQLGFSLDPVTLNGMTKDQFKAIKGKL